MFNRTETQGDWDTRGLGHVGTETQSTDPYDAGTANPKTEPIFKFAFKLGTLPFRSEHELNTEQTQLREAVIVNARRLKHNAV